MKTTTDLETESTSNTIRNFDHLPDSAFIRLPVLVVLFSISKASVWRRVSDGTIPKPIKLSIRTTVWRVGEIRHALAFKNQVIN